VLAFLGFVGVGVPVGYVIPARGRRRGKSFPASGDGDENVELLLFGELNVLHIADRDVPVAIPMPDGKGILLFVL
jgi:hypothetical protein